MSGHGSNFDWTDERVANLTKMCAEGYSGGQIAQAWGVTRNTICAKINRLELVRGEPAGLALIAATIPQPAKASRARQREVRKDKPPRVPKVKPEHQSLPTLAEMKAPRALPLEEAATETAVTTLAMQAGQCKWPLNDGKPEWLHCGDRQEPGSPYCAHHLAKSRGPGTKSERDAKKLPAFSEAGVAV